MTPDQRPTPVPGPPPAQSPSWPQQEDTPRPGPPSTATDQIDGALAGLDGLSDLPVAEHVARFDAVHSALTNALSSIDKV